MTKTKIGTTDEKAPLPEYTPQGEQQQVSVMMPAQLEVDHAGATCWYVVSILSTILCCFPCGVVGLVHAMIAKHEGERGNVHAHQRRMRQTKCWTSWSIALGLLGLVVLILFLVAASYYIEDYWGWGEDDYDYYKDYETTGKPDYADKPHHDGPRGGRPEPDW